MQPINLKFILVNTCCAVWYIFNCLQLPSNETALISKYEVQSVHINLTTNNAIELASYLFKDNSCKHL